MKKYLLKISVALLVLATFASCEEDRVVYDAQNGKTLAAFDKTSANLPVLEETVSTAVIRVSISTVSSVDRTMDVEIDEKATTALPAQYSIDEATFVVPAGAHYGDIKVTGNFAAFDANKYKLVLNLISVEGGAHIEEVRKTFTLTLFKSCPFDPSVIASSNYTGNSYLNSVSQDNFITSFQPVITKISDKVYHFDTLWGTSYIATIYGPDYEGMFVYPGTIVINDDLSLTITADASDSYGTGGSGNYDPCTNTFTYVLQQSAAQDANGNPVFSTPVILSVN